MNLFSTLKLSAAALALVFLFAVFLQTPVSAQTRGWGENDLGQLGIGNHIHQPYPQTVTAVPDATGISSGGEHTLFLKSDGTVAAAGDNWHGELGSSRRSVKRSSTPLAVPNLTNVVQVSAGVLHSAALLSDGTVWSWGFNLFGSLGNGRFTRSGCYCISTPTQTLITDVVQIDAGGSYTLALKADGTVWGWGLNNERQIDNSFFDRATPVRIGANIPGFNNFIAVSAGNSHSMALKADGTVWIWGYNREGQVGNNSTNSNYFPEQNTTLTNVTQIAGGVGHNMARRSDGSVWVWGRNAEGEIGNGTIGAAQLVPVQNMALSNVVEISTVGYHNLARLRDGSLRFWGANHYGEAGDGTTNQHKLTPIMPPVGAGNALIAAGYNQSFSLIPYLPTTAGINQRLYGENVDITFSNVTAGGMTSYRSIDPTETGLSVPQGYTIEPNQSAYNISTKATTGGDIDVCLKADGEYSQALFDRSRILHEEGANLVDRTFSASYRTRRICARVTSLSAFVIALAP